MKVEILQTRIWTLVQMLMIFELFSLESLDKVLLDKTIFVLSKTQIDLQTFAEDENAPIPVRKWYFPKFFFFIQNKTLFF